MLLIFLFIYIKNELKKINNKNKIYLNFYIMDLININLYIDINNEIFKKKLKKWIEKLNKDDKDEGIVYSYIKENMNKYNKITIFNTFTTYYKNDDGMNDMFLYKIYDLIKIEDFFLRVYTSYKYKTSLKTLSFIFYFAKIKNFNIKILDKLVEIIKGKDLIIDYYFYWGFMIDKKYSIPLVNKLINYIIDNKLDCDEYKILKKNIETCLEYFGDENLETINEMLKNKK